MRWNNLSPGQRKLIKFLAAGMVLFLILWASWLWMCTQVRASFIYGTRAEYAVMPGDDKELEKWMMEQPGMAKVFVFREGKELVIHFIMSQNLNREPPIPDIKAKCESLGYKGLITFKWE
jgi:hypothetical protein